MFYLIDDNLVGNPTFLRELCERIKPLKMKWASQCTLNLARKPELLKLVYDAGCRILSLGVETINQDGLDELGKPWMKANDHEELLQKIRKIGIMPSTEMIIGTDQDTEASIRETYHFIMRTKITIPRFYILTPIPGTDFFRKMKAAGRIMHEDFEKYTVSNCVHYPEKISPEKLNEMYTWINRKVFSLGSIISRVIFNRNFLNDPLLHLFALVVNLKYRRYTRRGDVPNIL